MPPERIDHEVNAGIRQEGREKSQITKDVHEFGIPHQEKGRHD
jgi:hypothetical protein